MLVRHHTATPHFDRSLDRAFEQLTNSFFETRKTAGPALDGRWQDDEYVLTVDLPGVPASAVSIDVAGSTLALAAETDSLTWHRSLRLSGKLDPDKITARHVDGRLTVRIGTVDEPEARSITIDTTAPEAIETSSTADDDQSSEANDSE